MNDEHTAHFPQCEFSFPVTPFGICLHSFPILRSCIGNSTELPFQSCCLSLSNLIPILWSRLLEQLSHYPIEFAERPRPNSVELDTFFTKHVDYSHLSQGEAHFRDLWFHIRVVSPTLIIQVIQISFLHGTHQYFLLEKYLEDPSRVLVKRNATISRSNYRIIIY